MQTLTSDVEIKEANGKYVCLRVTWPYFIILLLDRSGYTYFQTHFMYGKVWICVNKEFSSISCQIQQIALTAKIKISIKKWGNCGLFQIRMYQYFRLNFLFEKKLFFLIIIIVGFVVVLVKVKNNL